MSYTKTPIFLLTALALSLNLTACNRAKKTDTTTAASTTATTSTTTITEVSSAPDMTLASAAASTTDGTLVASGVAATSAPALTASATAPTALQMANVGNPKDAVRNMMEALRVGRVTYAMGFMQSDDKNLKKGLIQSLPLYKDIKSIKYAEAKYNEDGTMAMVKTLISSKTSKTPVEMPYVLQKTMTGWKVLAQTAPQTTNPALANTPTMPANVPTSRMAAGANGKPVPAAKLRTEDVIKAKTVAGTPEDAFKKAINTMMRAPASEAVKYYVSAQPLGQSSAMTAQMAKQASGQAADKAAQQADNTKTSKQKTTSQKITGQKAGAQKNMPMQPAVPTLEDKVAMQQALFLQALQSVKLGKTQYNKTKTEATVNAIFTPYAKTGSQPQPMSIKMVKDSNGEWKILSE